MRIFLSLDLLERVSFACYKAVYDYGLSVDDEIHSIELVGSGSRIPAIMRKLTSVFGKEPMRTLNGSECVARGCALSCAMLSPTFRVQDYKVFLLCLDIFSYESFRCLMNMHVLVCIGNCVRIELVNQRLICELCHIYVCWF